MRADTADADTDARRRQLLRPRNSDSGLRNPVVPGVRLRGGPVLLQHYLGRDLRRRSRDDVYLL